MSERNVTWDGRLTGAYIVACAAQPSSQCSVESSVSHTSTLLIRDKYAIAARMHPVAALELS